MLQVRLHPRHAVMRVRFVDKLQASDFTLVAAPAAQRLLERDGGIGAIILDLRRFAGWGELGTLTAQIAFLRRFSRSIARVAVLGPPGWAGAVPAITRLFVVAEVRCFAPGEARKLLAWVRQLPASGLR